MNQYILINYKAKQKFALLLFLVFGHLEPFFLAALVCCKCPFDYTQHRERALSSKEAALNMENWVRSSIPIIVKTSVGLQLMSSFFLNHLDEKKKKTWDR